MDREERRARKEHLVSRMLHGHPWGVVIREIDAPIARSTAYRWVVRARLRGDAALCDGRHGHASKLRPPVREWLARYCRASPDATGRMIQAALLDQFDVAVSIRHINSVRATLGVSRVPRRVMGQGVGEKWGACRAVRTALARGRGRTPPAGGRARDRPHPHLGGRSPTR